MKKSRAPGIIAGILFLLYGTVMVFPHLYSDERVVSGLIRLPSFLVRATRLIYLQGKDVLCLGSVSGGFLLGVLMLVVFLLISIGLFADKRVITAIGSGLGLLVQLPASFGVFAALQRASMRPDRFLSLLRMSFRTSLHWCVLLLNLLMLLVFVSLFIAALSRKAAGAFAWIGGGSAFLRLLPLGFLIHCVYFRGLHFALSPIGVVLTLMLAAATVLAGLSLRHAGARGEDAPAVQPRPAPAARPVQPRSAAGSQAGSRPAAAPGSGPDRFEVLRNFKQLLDEGVITQEEFDAKKKQLLGL